MEVVDALVEKAWVGHTVPTTTRTVLADNAAIITKLQSSECDPTISSGQSVLCIGAAAISITAQREMLIDFLPTYYMVRTR